MCRTEGHLRAHEVQLHGSFLQAITVALAGQLRGHLLPCIQIFTCTLLPRILLLKSFCRAHFALQNLKDMFRFLRNLWVHSNAAA